MQAMPIRDCTEFADGEIACFNIAILERNTRDNDPCFLCRSYPWCDIACPSFLAQVLHESDTSESPDVLLMVVLTNLLQL